MNIEANENTLTYKGVTYKFIQDKTIKRPCEVCDFKPECYNFMDDTLWIACGAITPTYMYLKKVDD